MRNVCFLVCALSFVPGHAHATEDTLHFAKHGFSIHALPGPSEKPQQVLMMMLPEQDGFAANVNVQAQVFIGTMDAYLNLSKTQFEVAKVKILVNRKLGENTAILEYTGQFSGREMHWYARAIRGKDKSKIYLTTATALEAQWTGVSAVLKGCVDSFKFD